MWNAVGVVKILKKRTKSVMVVFGEEIRQDRHESERAEWLKCQRFFSGTDFAELQATIESLSHSLCSQRLAEMEPSRVPPHFSASPEGLFSSIVDDERCPICLERCIDPVELSCSHKFCWKCFVLGPIAFSAPSEYRLERCPACRREQPLDPENFKTDSFCRIGSYLERCGVGSVEKEASHDSGLEVTDYFSSEAFRTTCEKKERHESEKREQQLAWMDKNPWQSTPFCILCCEPLLVEAVVTTPCKHHFHRVCLKKRDSLKCPLCDEDLPVSCFLPHNKEPDIRRLGGAWRVCTYAECPQYFSTNRDLQHVFPGGPCSYCGGWKLPQMPPITLMGAGGVKIPSYIHKVPWVGELGTSEERTKCEVEGRDISVSDSEEEERGFWSAVGYINPLSSAIKTTRKNIAKTTFLTSQRITNESHAVTNVS